MGFFSWETSTKKGSGKRGESIPNRHQLEKPTFPVKMLDNKGNEWVEESYDGYGDFGGMDYYALLDEMNGGSGDRERGINLAFSDREGVLFPALVRAGSRLKWEEVDPPKQCEFQGFFYLSRWSK